MHPSPVLSALLLAPFVTGTPITTRQTSATSQIAASQILQIAPTSHTCDSAPYPSECATASQAAPYLITAFQTHSITNPAQIAAILSLQAFETNDFKYSINHFPAPGRPGQGTRNMQMAAYNLLYARSIPELLQKLEAITTAESVDGLTHDQLNAVRELVLPDAYSWGSGAWFFSTQCEDAVKMATETPGEVGFAAYMGCVGTEVTSDRLAYYDRALKAFALS